VIFMTFFSSKKSVKPPSHAEPEPLLHHRAHRARGEFSSVITRSPYPLRAP